MDEPPARPAREGWPLAPSAVGDDDPLLGCLAALTRLFHRPLSTEALTAGLPIGPEGLSPDLFVRAAERAGLSARILKTPLERLAGASLPAVLLLNQRRAVVLVALEADGARIVAPETGMGERRIDREQLERDYAGHAIFVQPLFRFDARADDIAPRPKGSWFWGTLTRLWPTYGQVVVAAVLINIFALATPLFIMNVYDRVVPNSAISTLWVLAIGAATVYGFDFILRLLRGYFIDIAGKSADTTLSGAIFQHVLGLRMAARPQSAGAFANTLREFETIRDFFTSATLATLIDLPFAVFFILVIAAIAGPIALVPAAAVPIVVGAGLLLQYPLHRVVSRSFRESAQKHALLVEALNGLETIKSLSAEGPLQRQWERFVALTAQSALASRMLSSLATNLSAFVQGFVTIGVVIYGVYRIDAGVLSIGALIAATILTGRAMAPLAQIANLMTRLQQSRVSLEALDKVMALPLERAPEQSFLARPQFSGAIAFEDVHFTYPGSEVAALNGVRFSIRAGERVALIGRVGSGKSTLVKMILGLYGASEGMVLIDGTDIRQIDPADLRRNIGTVSQDVFLFYGSVRDNIALGAPHADDAAILRAATIAGVDEFVARHPSGYGMAVGERGEGLSGGQRQAIALARAIVQDPPILIFDEPTSAMDTRSEEQLKQRIAAVFTGRTIVLATHRASLLSLVERVIVIDRGRVVADGPRDKVLQALAQGRVKTAAEEPRPLPALDAGDGAAS